jgi:hypothetical protein
MERSTKIADLTYELMQSISKQIVSPLYYTEIAEDGTYNVLLTIFGEKLEKTIDETLTKHL